MAALPPDVWKGSAFSHTRLNTKSFRLGWAACRKAALANTGDFFTSSAARVRGWEVIQTNPEGGTK
jgi:hypothetical protein